MIIGINIKKLWEFANRQKFYFNEVSVINDFISFDKNDIDTLLELDLRYEKLENKFTGPIFFSHIKNIIPVTKYAKESFEQLCRLFPNISRFLR